MEKISDSEEIMDTEAKPSDTTTERGTEKHVKKHPSIGARLKKARETMGLTEKDAASRLNLNSKIITTIENDNFENGPPATFMRGYLRSYGRLLNLSEAETNELIEQLDMAVAPTMPKSISMPAHTRSINIHGFERHIRWLTYLIIFMLILLVSMWWGSHSHNGVTETTKPTPSLLVPTINPAAQPVLNPISPQPTVVIPTTPAAAAQQPPTLQPAAPQQPVQLFGTPQDPTDHMQMALPEPDL